MLCIDFKFGNFKLKNFHDYYDFMYTLWDPIMYVHTEGPSL